MGADHGWPARPLQPTPDRALGHSALTGTYVGLVGMLLLLVASSERLTATGAAEIVGHFTATISGALCLGGLVFTLITAIPEDRGVLDPLPTGAICSSNGRHLCGWFRPPSWWSSKPLPTPESR